MGYSELIGAMGDVMIGGSALVDIVGAEAASQILEEAKKQGIAVKSAALVERDYKDLRTLYLGIPAVTFGATAGIRSTATVKTTNPIKLTRLVLPVATAALTNVDQLDIGSDKQILNGNPLPGDMFRPDSFGADMMLDTLNPQIDLYLGFVNVTATAQVIYAGFRGQAARR